MRRGSLRVEAVADDGTGAVRVVWHNRYPSFTQAAQSGRSLALYGTPVATPRGELRLENPETEFFGAGEEADPLHSGRIVGVYHRVAGIAARAWRQLVRAALDAATQTPAATSLSGEEILRALKSAHFPERMEDAEGARSRLAGEELLV